MHVLTNQSYQALWSEVVRSAEDRCSIALRDELETYLVSLLIRYTDKPEVAKQLFAASFLKAMQSSETEKFTSLQSVGDQCLLFAGLFPQAAEKRLVKISYFVDLGRSSYSCISQRTNDLFLHWPCSLLS